MAFTKSVGNWKPNSKASINSCISLTKGVLKGHEATDTGLAYAPVSQAHGP